MSYGDRVSPLITETARKAPEGVETSRNHTETARNTYAPIGHFVVGGLADADIKAWCGFAAFFGKNVCHGIQHGSHWRTLPNY